MQLHTVARNLIDSLNEFTHRPGVASSLMSFFGQAQLIHAAPALPKANAHT